MARARRTRSKIIASTLGLAALGAAFLMPSASASVSDGKFVVHAWNIETPKVEAFAGLKGVTGGSGGGGGGSAPAPAVTLATYSYGPISFQVTDAMVAFSRANQDLQAAGKTSEIQTSSDGWQSIWYYSSADGKLVAGFPSDGSKPSQVYFSTTMSAPDRTADYPSARLYAKVGSTSSTLQDTRRAPAIGDSFYYYFSKAFSSTSKDSYSEGRYTDADGSVVPTRISSQTWGWSVDRKASALSPKPFLSNRFPSNVGVYDDGTRTAVVTFKDTIDGYNYSTFRQNADGSGYMSYAYWNGAMSSYGTITGVGAPSRTNGPTAVQWDSSGNITSLSSPGKTITAPFTAAHYNEITGQNWDGSYLKASDLNLEKPFTPTPNS